MSTKNQSLTAMDFISKFRSQLYDKLIGPISSHWYREVLQLLPENVIMLDIGIGTAASLIANSDLVIKKNLQIIGVDYCQAYIKFATQAVAKSAIKQRIQLLCTDIHKYNESKETIFDVAYFSGSFMIIPEQTKALRHVTKMLKPRKFEKQSREGNIFFTQTFENSAWIGRYFTTGLKKLLRIMTTIDFGEVTYEQDFHATLKEAAVEIVDIKLLKSSYFRRQVLVVARPQVEL